MRNRVRENRQERQLSQAALAEAVGVSRQTINAIETGRYLPSLPLAFALAGYSARPSSSCSLRAKVTHDD